MLFIRVDRTKLSITVSCYFILDFLSFAYEVLYIINKVKASAKGQGQKISD